MPGMAASASDNWIKLSRAVCSSLNAIDPKIPTSAAATDCVVDCHNLVWVRGIRSNAITWNEDLTALRLDACVSR